MNCVYTCLFSKMLVRKNSKTLNTTELKKASQSLEDSVLVGSGEALTTPDDSHDLKRISNSFGLCCALARFPVE